MGLLDFASDPQGMQGLALLAAAGPSMTPMNGASRIALAGSTYRGLLDDQLKQKLTQAQLSEFDTKNQLQQFQLQRLKDWQGLLTGGGNSASAPAFGPDDIKSPGAFTPSVDGMGPVAPLDQAPAALTARPQQGFQFGLRGMPDANSRAVAASMTPDEYMKLYATQAAPQTDIEKLMAAQGIDRSSPVGQQLLTQAIQKTNYIAPVNARPGSIIRDPGSNLPIAFNPQVPEGSTPVFDAQGNVSAFRKIANADEAIGVAPAARKHAENTQTPSVVYGADGKPRFSTVAQDVSRASGQMPAPQSGFTGSFVGDPAKVMADVLDIKDPQERSNALAALQAQIREQGGGTRDLVTPQQAPGAVQGANLSQDELSKKWSTLSQANSEAQNTRSYLDNIKQMASQAATGPFTNRLQFANALLAGVGNERAMNATTANNLLDKYSNQIVARLGTGGLGTDAARSILQSAYPNAHMTVDAINEAADNLKGAQSMVQTKTRLLQQAANARDPAKYNQIETAFDQAADPRIWQLSEMAPAQQAAYIKTLPPTVAADLLKRRQTLRGLGAF